jgi:hypothetical protein
MNARVSNKAYLYTEVNLSWVNARKNINMIFYFAVLFCKASLSGDFMSLFLTHPDFKNSEEELHPHKTLSTPMKLYYLSSLIWCHISIINTHKTLIKPIKTGLIMCCNHTCVVCVCFNKIANHQQAKC